VIDLRPYQEHFDVAYEEYGDTNYEELQNRMSAHEAISRQVKALDAEILETIRLYLAPIVSIRNYKAQVPMNEDVLSVADCVAALASETAVAPLEDGHCDAFCRLLDMKGHQLPTVSAYFHFCHPNEYPIVDRNVQNACELLSSADESLLPEFAVPVLPYVNTSRTNKKTKYLQFIAYLSNLRDLHNDKHGTNYEYRDLDKALMVYGVKRLREAVECP